MRSHASLFLGVVLTTLAGLSFAALLSLVLFARRLWRMRPAETPRCPLSRKGLLQLGVAALAAVLLMNALGLLARRHTLLTSLEGQVTFALATFWIVYPLLLLLIHRLLGGTWIAWKHAFGLSSAGKGLVAGAAVALGLAVFVPAVVAGIGWHALLQFVGFSVEPQPVIEWFFKIQDPRLLAGLVVLAVVAAPVAEEVFFRGILHPFLTARFGSSFGLALGALAFAGFHLHLPSLAPLFVLAVALALAYEWSGNLVASIVIHAGFNAVAVAGLLAQRMLQ